MRWSVHHSALGIPSPTLASLRAACDPEARALWNAAAALATWRNKQHRAVSAELGTLYDDPSTVSAPALPEPEPGVGPDDLARALIALRPDLVGRLGQTAAADRWRARIGPPCDGELSYTWGRRWAAISPGTGIDTLIRSLPQRTVWALAALDPDHAEGLITANEAYRRVLDSLYTGGDIGPAYLERTEDRAWRRALIDGPGLAIVGEPGSGKRTVAWRLRQLLWPRAVNVDNHHGGGPPDPRYRARPELVPTSVSPGLVCVWTEAVDPELLRYAVELAFDADAGFQLVLAATDPQWARVRSIATDATRFPVVRLSPPYDHELLPIWLCQRPFLEDQLGEPLGLFELLGRVPPDRLRSTLYAIDTLRRDIGPQSNHVRLRELLAPARWSFRSLGRVVARDPGEAHRQLLRRLPGLEPFLSGPERLVELLELDAALSGG